MWGDLGISKVSLNDKELEPISEGCRYTYALGNVRTKNVLKMTVNSNFINNVSKILSQIVFSRYYGHFYYEKNLGPKVAQKSIFRPIFEIKNRFLSKFFSLKIIFLPFILILFFSDQQQWKIGNDLSHWSTANLSTEFREEPQHASILKFEGK